MTVKITKLDHPDSGKVVFFHVLLESEGCAIVSSGWRIFENRIYPPATRIKASYYVNAVVSGKLAKAIQEALEAQGYPDLDEDAWVSAKWGQEGLKRVVATPEDALSLWQKYKTEKA